jgi:4-hydroxymandelate oxidase
MTDHRLSKADLRRNRETLLGRRMLLRFLAGSPVLAALGWGDLWPAEPGTAEESALFPSALSDLKGATDGLITSPEGAINVFDFASVARESLPPAHYGYLATGVEDDGTLRANREAFGRIGLRPRRLVDVSRIDMNTDLLGVSHSSPIVLAPAGSPKAYHPEGEVAVARAARTQGHLQILSTVSTSSIAEVAAARGEPLWYQLYPTSQWEITRALLQQAEDAGCRVVVLTVDIPTSSNRETEQRFKRKDSRNCSSCHAPGIRGYLERKSMFKGLDVAGLDGLLAPAMTWEFVDRLKDATPMKVVLKGIVTGEDARLSLEHQVDGLIVSNHGGRAEESGRASMESLPEVMDEVKGKIPVMVDGGFRRGSDIFKALAMGASAVCIGRPYLWGLAAFGQPGVEMVLKILRAELRDVMMFAGTPTLGDIRRSHVHLD